MMQQKVPRVPYKAIDVVESGKRARPDRIAFTIDDDVAFSTAALESYAFAAWEPLIYDALLVTAAIEYSDKIVKRHPHGWTRHIELRIPVHNLSHWNSSAVYAALKEALEFLTGDIWDIRFVARSKPAPVYGENYLSIPTGTRAILAFSEGMDSRAVAGLVGQELGAGLVRVRVGSKTADRPRKSGIREPFAAVPYKVTANMQNRETSARSRGFKFSMISAIAAYLTDAPDIIIPESGQGIIGPALITVGHAYPDYRNHPRFARRMEQFIQALFGKDIRYRFPRIWHTKGETLRAFAAIDADGSWRGTKSCWRNNQWSSVAGKYRQCGICAACMLRRLSVHAAGLVENTDTYIVTDMSAKTLEKAVDPAFKRMNAAFREYAIAGAMHMDHLADMADPEAHSAVQRHATIMASALDTPPDEVTTRLQGMLEQHAREWKQYKELLGDSSFIRQWVRTHTNDD